LAIAHLLFRYQYKPIWLYVNPEQAKQALPPCSRGDQETPQTTDPQKDFGMRPRFVARPAKIRLYFPVKTESIAGR
jgi:hypothetical protein